MNSDDQPHVFSGQHHGRRIASRVLEEHIQEAVREGKRSLMVHAFGQHGIGGRLRCSDGEAVHVNIQGHPGQRVGSMGYPNTHIKVMGPASDDVGWLNTGAEITVHGHASNGVANAMAQGKIYVAGNIGARGMTMTKHNPRFAPPELWVLGSAGDYFGEFMAGGIAVICGHAPQNAGNVLGYRPLVGMVGGKVFLKGPHGGFSQTDAKMVPIGDGDWSWLQENMQLFLEKIGRIELKQEMGRRDEWQLLRARLPHEKTSAQRRSMAQFRQDVWDRALGVGGLVGDLTDVDRSPIPVITRGDLRRQVPVWENGQYISPCQDACPTGIPVQARWRMVREGRVDEAVDMALAYTPFPATVCGYLCPNLCMQSCTKQSAFMTPVDITGLGKASIDANLPEFPALNGKRVAVVGGGPAGISMAWQLRLQGIEAVVYDATAVLGGKVASVIPNSRIPKAVVAKELERIQEVIPHVHLQQRLTAKDTEALITDFDAVVIAAGARKPRLLNIPGKERMIGALEFLSNAKKGTLKVGTRVVVIGAGNVGCDVATEAARLGADKLTLLDVQTPASFGKEREDAEAAGAEFRWPVFTSKITAKGVVLEGGELIPADTVVVSIGDVPDLAFLPEDVAVEKGHVKVDAYFQTTNPKVFAVGDIVRPGLLTDAIGAGRKAAAAIGDILEGKRPSATRKQVIDIERVSMAYYDPRITAYEDLSQCGSQCASCGQCRDCGICVAMCPESAISRMEKSGDAFEYVVDASRCIGCGFCAGACPCGIWNLVENTPIE
ncbi:MAG: FAD-dependent oxidoreductase [Deltaproteobacteria bacterium]|nr:FAD-dependent oxidoreductase [Deltaproteobacteria bacterium]